METIASPERHVGDYLTEEVLRHQPEQVRRFLLATSVLEQMSGPLCEYVTGHPLAQTMLEELDRTSMFVTRVNGRVGGSATTSSSTACCDTTSATRTRSSNGAARAGR